MAKLKDWERLWAGILDLTAAHDADNKMTKLGLKAALYKQGHRFTDQEFNDVFYGVLYSEQIIRDRHGVYRNLDCKKGGAIWEARCRR